MAKNDCPLEAFAFGDPEAVLSTFRDAFTL